RTSKALQVTLSATAFDSTDAKLTGVTPVTVPANGSAKGRATLHLPTNASHGTYSWFLRADFNGLTRWGWGIVANPGAPDVDAQARVPDRVTYAQPVTTLAKLPWTGPITVAWGPDAPVLELESAYLVANSLSAATGTPVSYMSTADLPPSAKNKGMLILVGT